MQKSTINLSVNPSYFCNFRCQFCYLSDEQLKTRKFLSKDLLFARLTEISSAKIIKHIDLYGGEIGLIPVETLQEYLTTFRFFFQGKINVITNLSAIHPLFHSEDVELTVSWDYLGRESHERVYENMKKLTQKFHVLILGSERVVNMSGPELSEMISLLNQLPHLSTVEIKPYSENLHRHQKVTFRDFEMFVQRWIELKEKFRFEFINEVKIQDSLGKKYSSWSDDHLYLTPEGKYAVLEFTKDNKEYFHEVDSLEEYEKWAESEKLKVTTNPFCTKCEYLGSCLSEHLQEVMEEGSCNGFKGLLDWYRTKQASSSC